MLRKYCKVSLLWDVNNRVSLFLSPLTIGAVDDIRVNAGVGEEEGKAFGPALVSRRPQWRASYEEEEGGRGRRKEGGGRRRKDGERREKWSLTH